MIFKGIFKLIRTDPFYRILPAISRGLIISLLSLILTINWPLHTLAQIPNLPPPIFSPPVVQVGNLISAPVRFDGYELFTIAAAATDAKGEPDKIPIQRRVELIETELNAVIKNQHFGGILQHSFDPHTLQVTVETSNNATVIVAADGKTLKPQQLMTVTEPDSQINGMPLSQWANQVSRMIQIALIRAYQQRQPDYLLRQSAISLALTILAFLADRVLISRQKGTQAQKKQLLRNKEQTEIQDSSAIAALSTDTEQVLVQQQSQLLAVQQQLMLWKQQLDINLLKQRLWQWGRVVIWSSIITVMVGLFPWSRWLQLFLVRKPIALLMIWIGSSLAVRLSAVGIDKFLLVWQEASSLTPLTPTESQRRTLRFSTFAVVLKGIATFFVAAVGIISVLNTLSIPTGPILAGAGLLSLAISFGSQSLVKDVLNGCFILLEDQYAVGDVIEVAGTMGLVEYMNLRITKLRGAGGRLSTIPNSSIAVVHNFTKDWSRVDINLEISADADIILAMQVIKQAAETLKSDAEWQDKILDAVNVLGVENITPSAVQIIIGMKTQAGQQWAIAREFRQRLKQALTQNGIR